MAQTPIGRTRIAATGLVLTGLALAGCTSASTATNLTSPNPTTSAAPSSEPVAPAPLGRAAGGKEIYLTVDDGPSASATGEMLDLFKQLNVKATFFVLGKNLDQQRELAKRAMAEGHVVANHTWTHATLTKLDQQQFDEEVDKTQNLLREVGSTSTCLRPPSGAKNDRTDQWLNAKGLRRVLWNVETEDWSKPGAAVIAERIRSGAAPGKTILVHDGGGDRSQTVQALRDVLPKLIADGYTFPTVPGC